MAKKGEKGEKGEKEAAAEEEEAMSGWSVAEAAARRQRSRISVYHLNYMKQFIWLEADKKGAEHPVKRSKLQVSPFRLQHDPSLLLEDWVFNGTRSG